MEPLVLSALVEEGNLKNAYRAGIGKNDFQIYFDEFEWLEKRFQSRKPISRRIFCERFQDFEFVVSRESLDDLLQELKTERAYGQVAALLETVSETLLPENSIETAEHMREVLAEVLKSYSPHSDIDIKNFEDHFEKIRQHRIMAKAGHTVGMPLLIPTIDYHWDGLLPGRLIGVLGRPGEGKSSLIAWASWVSVKTGYNTGLFSPEMNEFEHTCRIHTLASADPEVQKACNLKKSFRNRDLMRGTGFDLKAYKRFLEYFSELPGYCHIFTKKYRRAAITPQYIASRIEDLGLHGIIVDPISKISVGHKRRDNPVWEAYDKVNAFQELGEEHNVFALATNWSHRQSGKSKSEKAPDLDESFGSDALAQEADHIIGVKYDEEDGTLSLRCTKSRFGKNKFTAVVDFKPNTGRFIEVNMDYEVAAYRLSLNGKASSNGNGYHKKKVKNAVAVKKAKPKVKKAVRA